MDKPQVSIIIPFFDCFDLVFQRLAEIQSLNICSGVEVILANDGSVEPKTYLQLEQARKMFPFRTVGFEENHGFSSVNRVGALEAEGEVLCFLSSDVKIMKNFIGLVEHLKGRWLGGRYLQYDTGWNKFGEVIFPYLEGWFVACRADEFWKVGGWDSRFDPHDYEDIDLSTAAIRGGYTLEEIPDGYLKHIGCGTLSRKKTVYARAEITKSNQEIFRQKWLSRK